KGRDLDVGRRERQALEKTAALFQNGKDERNKKQHNCSHRQDTSPCVMPPIEQGREHKHGVVEICRSEESRGCDESGEAQPNFERRESERRRRVGAQSIGKFLVKK